MEPSASSSRRLRKTNYFFHRELYGDRNGVPAIPAAAAYKKNYRRASIVGLDGSGELKKHIIIGERPTYPYHVVTIRKPSLWTASEFGDLFSPDGYTDGTGGSIAYWEFIQDEDRNENISGAQASISGIHLRQIDREIPINSTIENPDTYLTSAFTAWDIRRDFCAQVLYWKDNGSGFGTSSLLQIRYGEWNYVVELGRYMALVGACFLGLNCSKGYGEGWGDGATISVVLPTAVYFFEPFGWTNRKVPELRYWHTTPETLHDEQVMIGGKQYTPRVSVLKLDIYIRQFLLQKFPSQFATRQPQLQKMFSNFVGKRKGIRSGRQSDFRITQIAIGVVEKVTGSYYFFVLSLDHTQRLIKPSIARSLSSEDGHSYFSPDSLQYTPSQRMFDYAAKRIMGGQVHVDSSFLEHSCSKGCVDVPGNMIKCLCSYSSEMSTMKEIWMEEAGVVLEGWNRTADERDNDGNDDDDNVVVVVV